MVEGMVKEVCTRYGELFEIWFDGGADSPERGAPDVLPIVKKYQPNCLFYHNTQLAEARWGGSETGTVGVPCWATFPFPSTDGALYPVINENNYGLLKHGDPDGKYWMPAMADAPLRGYNGRHEWFWEPGDENHVYPLENLVDMYYKSVGRNATLILGLTPDPDGLLPEPDVARMKEFGDEINSRFEKPVASVSGEGKTLVMKLKEEVVINTMVLQEQIENGEHIRQYSLQAKVAGRWQDICAGQSVWHKCIREFKPVTTSRLRLVFDQYVKEPEIKDFSIFLID
jgi:alpha-L-fucosidase